MLNRLEKWAADSPERARLLVVALCVGLGLVVLSFILALAWVMLDPGAIKDLVE